METGRFSLSSGLIGSAFAVVVSATVSVIKQIKSHKLNTEKQNLTDSLNQEIGYHRCRLDDLKNERSLFESKNIFKMHSMKKQRKDVDEKICNEETLIRDLERRIDEIRSSNTLRMLRYVENKM